MRLAEACYAAEMGTTPSTSVVEVWARALAISRRSWLWRLWMRLSWDPFDGQAPPDDEVDCPSRVRFELLQLAEEPRAMVVLVLKVGVTVRDAAAVVGIGEAQARQVYEEAKVALGGSVTGPVPETTDLVATVRRRLDMATSDMAVPAFGLVWARAKHFNRDRWIRIILASVGAVALTIASVIIVAAVLRLKDDPTANQPSRSIPASRMFDETK